jgi:hypothetical protein
LILLDLMMPVMDGWEFMKRQRRDWHLCTIPTIVVSGVRVARSARASKCRSSVCCPSPTRRAVDGGDRCGNINPPGTGPSAHAARNTTTGTCTASPHS